MNLQRVGRVSKETTVPELIISGEWRPQESAPEGVTLRTFVSQLCGATGFSTGTASFRDGAELAYHTHTCSEAITVLKGRASVLVEGRGYQVGPLDSIHI